MLLFGVSVGNAEKWDKNNFEGKGIEAGYYDADSIKVNGALVSWTEKYAFDPGGAKFFTSELSKNKACKENVSKKGDIAQFPVDYQYKSGKYRQASRRYYNKSVQLICADNDLGKDFDTNWYDTLRTSPIEEALYDLITKYKIPVR